MSCLSRCLYLRHFKVSISSSISGFHCISSLWFEIVKVYQERGRREVGGSCMYVCMRAYA